MDKTSRREDRTSDEIDLRVVFRKLASFAGQIRDGIRRSFFLLLRRWPLVLFLVLVGIGLSYLIYLSQRPFYRSSVTLVPSEIRNRLLQEQVNRLATLLLDGNTETVASDLHLSPEEAANIKSVQYVEIDPFAGTPDTVLVGAAFRVDAELYDRNFFPAFQKALIGYFERNAFFSRSTQSRREQLQNTIAKLKEDIASIDSIKRAAVTLKGPTNGLVYGEPLDPTNLYKQSAALYENQALLEDELRKLETMQVAVAFAPLIHQTGPRLKWHLAIGALVGFLLAFLLAQAQENRKNSRINNQRVG
ncbi:hypothetical protein ACFSC6_00820 [Rufibacter sediminis]|uniref:Lipopolysaccharide biosynthesis protein n=1 Tax=Rufibacter sediminis TaxID=2762756 RepID=A0ABR6VLP4_9BACT|nr:hypothetical protein [Rufibacter sediminis]MBC3538108.1 hypothetical protein [Rufibacter sediminis]